MYAHRAHKERLPREYHVPRHLPYYGDGVYLSLAYRRLGLPNLWLVFDSRPFIHFFRTFYGLPYELYTRFFPGLYDVIVRPALIMALGVDSPAREPLAGYLDTIVTFFFGVGCSGPSAAARLRKFFYSQRLRPAYPFTRYIDEVTCVLNMTLSTCASTALNYLVSFSTFSLYASPHAFFVRAFSNQTSTRLPWPHFGLPYKSTPSAEDLAVQYLDTSTYATLTLPRGAWGAFTSVVSGSHTPTHPSLGGQPLSSHTPAHLLSLASSAAALQPQLVALQYTHALSYLSATTPSTSLPGAKVGFFRTWSTFLFFWTKWLAADVALWWLDFCAYTLGVETLTQFHVLYLYFSTAASAFTSAAPFHLVGLFDALYFYALLGQHLIVQARGYVIATYTMAVFDLLAHSSSLAAVVGGAQYYFTFWHFHVISYFTDPQEFARYLEEVFMVFFHRYTPGLAGLLIWMIDNTTEPLILNAYTLIPRPLAYFHPTGWFLRPFSELLSSFELRHTLLSSGLWADNNPYFKAPYRAFSFMLTRVPAGVTPASLFFIDGGTPLFTAAAAQSLSNLGAVVSGTLSAFVAYTHLRLPRPVILFTTTVWEELLALLESAYTTTHAVVFKLFFYYAQPWSTVLFANLCTTPFIASWGVFSVGRPRPLAEVVSDFLFTPLFRLVIVTIHPTHSKLLKAYLSAPAPTSWAFERLSTARFDAATGPAGYLGQLGFMSSDLLSLAQYYRRIELAQDWRSLKLEREVWRTVDMLTMAKQSGYYRKKYYSNFYDPASLVSKVSI